jgi:hypothetical protein
MARVGQGWRSGAIVVGLALAVLGAMRVGLVAKAPTPPRPPIVQTEVPVSAAIRVAAVVRATEPQPLPAANSRSLPAPDLSAEQPLRLPPLPVEVVVAPPQLPSPPASVAPDPSRISVEQPPRSAPRNLTLSALAAWSKPGLCTASPEAAGVRETVIATFRLSDSSEPGKLYFDPRLPDAAEAAILNDLAQAESELVKRLNLRPPRPVVFVYLDQQLMKAAACINEDAVAFYDGALHIVAGRADVLQSVLHEYTHHALFSSGVIGPAWAQEGIAMSVAHETWWREPRWLQALLAAPFAQDDMDRMIPYKLAPEQAVAFYVQSAALVECVLRRRSWQLPQLVDALRAGTNLATGSLSYDLPELAEPSFLRDCLTN